MVPTTMVSLDEKGCEKMERLIEKLEDLDDEQKENPHIVGSNDLINWEVPKGLVNPLDDVEGDNHKQYNSDSHLVYVKDTDTLECYWRYVNDEDGSVTIYKRTTKNGK